MQQAIAARAAIYGGIWSVIAWQSLHGGSGDADDHAVLAMSLFLIHGIVAFVLAGAPAVIRTAGLAFYVPAAALLLLLLLFHGLFVQSGGVIGADAVRAVAQTDATEAWAYLERLISLPDALIALGVALLLAVAFPRARGPRIGLTGSLSLIAALGAGAMFAHAAALSIAAPVQQYVSQYRAEMGALRSMIEAGKAMPMTEAASDFQGTVIVVIGESISRRHMGRYGYFRDTTPLLNARAEQWIAFTDVISPHSHTVPALPSAFISAGVDIVSLARSAGFRTYWLSNQNQFGVWDNPVSVIAHLADYTRFFSGELGRMLRRSVPDHEMLPSLEQIASQPGPGRKLVFVHLFTNHWPYCANRRDGPHFQGELGPKFFGRAAEPKDVNCYDDGIRYADWLLERIVGIAEASSGPAAVVYFSDHGEAPLLGTGHDSFRHSSYHIEIPLLVWANGEFARRYPAPLEAARANAEHPYSTARLFHSLAHFLDVRHPSVEARHSVFSPQLVDLSRTSLEGAIHYDRWAPGNDIRENAAANMRALGGRRGAVWAHRVNSLGALLEAAAIFQGVELDLIYVDDDRCFRVRHPPAPDTSLSLEEMLRAAAHRPALRLWLDWKNATPQNMEGAIRCLRELDRKFDIRARALVETGSDAVFAQTRRLSEAGFRHGYYLPTETIAACMKTCSDAGAHALAVALRRTVAQGGYTAITFDWRLKAFVRRWMADWARAQDIGLYSWDTSIDVSRHAEAGAAIEQRFSELGLAALLVTFPSPFAI